MKPTETVLVCANYRQCPTVPPRLLAVNPHDPIPTCTEGLPMTTKIEWRDWPHRFRDEGQPTS